MARIKTKQVKGIKALVRDENDRAIRDFAIHTLLLPMLTKAMTKDSYGVRARSRWIAEALSEFLLGVVDVLDPDTWNPTRVFDQSIQEAGSRKIRLKLQLPDLIDRELARAALKVRASHPEIDGEISYVLRCSILFRIIHPNRFTWVDNESPVDHWKRNRVLPPPASQADPLEQLLKTDPKLLT